VIRALGLALILLGGTSASGATLVVSVGGGADDPAFLPLHVAAALGTFEAEGVEVTLRRAKHPTGAMDALRDRDAGVAATTLDRAIRDGFGRGVATRVLVAHTRAPSLVLLASRAGSPPVTRVAELRGRRIGIPGPGTTGDLVLRSLLSAERLEPWELEIRSLGGAALAARLASGDLAAAVVEEPWASRVLAAGTAAVLLDLRRPAVAAQVLGGPFYEMVSVARADGGTAREDEAALAAFARALIRVQAWLATAPPGAVADRLPAALVGDRERFLARLAPQQALYVPSGEATVQGLDASLRVLRRGTPWPASVKVDARDLREPELVTAARTRLGAVPPAP
jgi:NitT/TauT family transport system substrate-binding protein